MKVVCIEEYVSYLTRYRLYDVVGQSNTAYTIIDDTGYERPWPKYRFELAEDKLSLPEGWRCCCVCYITLTKNLFNCCECQSILELKLNESKMH